MLRDRIARALPAWGEGMPGWHALLGMHAFGLEECGDYDSAERQGRRSVELEPRDSWGWHAVAHVLEMRHAPGDGIAWLQPNSGTWRCTTWNSTFTTRSWRSTTGPSAAPARRWCWTWSTPAPCCGA
jgi:hypothetical protein